MANNFSSVSFPLEGARLHFKLCYQVITKSLSKHRTYSLDLEFKFIQNSFAKDSAWPTVQALSDEFNRLVVSKVIPILGKNVQITGLWMISGSTSVNVHVYQFGSGSRNAVLPEINLVFVLQPFHKRNNYRLHVKGAALEFQSVPLSEPDKASIFEFETLYTSVLSLFDGDLMLQYVRNNDSIISSVFKESVKISKGSSPSAKKPKPSVQRAPNRSLRPSKP